jgi:Flp pilus assembly pilin Flp
MATILRYIVSDATPTCAALTPERSDTMKSVLCRFFGDESGAVTVDWVVLTAAIVGLGALVLTPIAFSADNTAGLVGASVAATPVGYTSP